MIPYVVMIEIRRFWTWITVLRRNSHLLAKLYYYGCDGRGSVVTPPRKGGITMSSDVTKRALSAGLGVGALALLAPRASADTPFSSFAFPATGAPAARTMPDRLAERKNVKDFGAVGNGQADDTPAIQAAVNSAAGQMKGVIFFPPGVYRTTAPILFNTRGDDHNIHFLGCGLASHIVGAHSDFIIRRDSVVGASTGTDCIEKLRISGPNAIQWNDAVVLNVRDCLIEASNGIWIYEEAYPPLIEGCVFRGNNTQPGVAILGQASIISCDITGCYEGVRLRGNSAIIGCRIEMCQLGVVIGVDQNNNDRATGGVHINSTSFEGNRIAIDVRQMNSSVISSIGIQGQDFGPGGGSLHAIRIRYSDYNVFEAIATGGWFSDAVINFTAQPGKTTFISVGSHKDAGAGALWSAIPAGVTFINCNQPGA
jgi:hypothetical protein